MADYTDDEIRNMKKITCKIAGDYLGISPMAVSIGKSKDEKDFRFGMLEDTRTNSSKGISASSIGISAAKTGDESQVGLWFALRVVSLLFLLLIAQKRKNVSR